MKKILVFFTIFCSFSIEYVKASTGFPQLDVSTYPEQIFWFLIIFALLYLFIYKYVIPKIKTIQNSRERLIKQNITNNSKNISEISKIQNLIAKQLSTAQKESKNAISKVTQDLLHIEDRRINEIKLANNKIKDANHQNNLRIEEEFLKNFHSSVKDVTQIILNKLEITLPDEVLTEEIKKMNIVKADKDA